MMAFRFPEDQRIAGEYVRGHRSFLASVGDQSLGSGIPKLNFACFEQWWQPRQNSSKMLEEQLLDQVVCLHSLHDDEN